MARRFGRLTVQRQVLVDGATQTHVMPGNALLPPHGGIVITRGLQELACLLPDTLPFATAARLLGWQTQAEGGVRGCGRVRCARWCGSTGRCWRRPSGWRWRG